MREQAIRSLVGPLVESRGLEVDRIEIMNAGKRVVLRIFLDGDGPDGRGPSLDEIAGATRAISAALDAGNAAGERPYTLEVSSRGATRPLTEPRHFRRNTGRLVKLTLRSQGAVTGRIIGVDADGVGLDVDGSARSVSWQDIARAVVQLEMRKDVAELDEDDGLDAAELDEED